MLSYRNSTLHFYGFIHHVIDEALYCCRLLWLVWIVHYHLMEVAVADVA